MTRTTERVSPRAAFAPARWGVAAWLGVAMLAGCTQREVVADDTADAAAADTADTLDAADTEVDVVSPRPDVVVDITLHDTVAPDPARCRRPEDCALCRVGRVPTAREGCVCPGCPVWPKPSWACEADSRAWEAVCDNADAAGVACPATVACPPEGPVACEGERCVDPCRRETCPALTCAPEVQLREPGACCPTCPAVCDDAAGCVRCAYAAAPEQVSDCACPGCAVYPTDAATCADRGAAARALCIDTPGWDACSPPKGCPALTEAPICDGGRCVESPGTCTEDRDCVLCAAPPTAGRPEDCRCAEGCTVTTGARCRELAALATTVCGDALDGCAPTCVDLRLRCDDALGRCVPAE